MNLSEYTQDLVAKYVFDATAFPASPSTFLNVCTSNPLADGSGATFAIDAEPVTFHSTYTITEVDGVFTMNDAPVVLSGLPSGTYTHFAIFDAASGGNMLAFGSLSVPISGTIVSFNTNTLSVGVSGNASHYLAEQVLDWMLDNGTPTPPAAVKVGLSLTPILRAGTGLTEPGTGYLRQDFVATAPVFDVNLGTSVFNASFIAFGPALSNWNNISHIGLFDSAGPLLFHGALTSPRTVEIGEGISWAVSGLEVRVR